MHTRFTSPFRFSQTPVNPADCALQRQPSDYHLYACLFSYTKEMSKLACSLKGRAFLFRKKRDDLNCPLYFIVSLINTILLWA